MTGKVRYAVGVINRGAARRLPPRSLLSVDGVVAGPGGAALAAGQIRACS